MLMWLLILLTTGIAFPVGWILGCEYAQRNPVTINVPSRLYADDFADHLSGRVYDQENPGLASVPAATRPIGSRWDTYRGAA